MTDRDITLVHPSIVYYCYLCRVAGGLEPIPADAGCKLGYTLHKDITLESLETDLCRSCPPSLAWIRCRCCGSLLTRPHLPFAGHDINQPESQQRTESHANQRPTALHASQCETIFLFAGEDRKKVRCIELQIFIPIKQHLLRPEMCSRIKLKCAPMTTLTSPILSSHIKGKQSTQRK